MTNKVDAFDMPLKKAFHVFLENIVWAPGIQGDMGDEWFPKHCNVVVEADRNSPISDIVRAAKVGAAKRFGAGVLSADATISRPEDLAATDETLEYEGEIYGEVL